jgi:hypothetical protein
VYSIQPRTAHQDHTVTAPAPAAMAPTYLVDFSCYKPPEELRVDSEECRVKGKHWSVGGRTGGGEGCCGAPAGDMDRLRRLHPAVARPAWGSVRASEPLASMLAAVVAGQQHSMQHCCKGLAASCLWLHHASSATPWAHSI